MAQQDWSPLTQGRQGRRYRAGELIYLQDTDSTLFFYLAEGTARSFISSEAGSERLLTVHHAGDLMGEASFFDGCPRVSSAQALTDCRAVSISKGQLDAVFQLHPELAMPMLRYLARTVRMLSGHVDDISFRPADERLARYLLSVNEEPIRLTHQELSDAIGASRVTVSRALGSFERLGFLKTGYKSIVIADRDGLGTFCGE